MTALGAKSVMQLNTTLNGLACVGALTLAACVSQQSRERPGTWPTPVVSSAGLCTPISGRFKDSPTEELLGTQPKYMPSSLAELLVWQLWRRDSGPKPIVAGNATITDVAVGPSGASLSVFNSSGRLLAAYSSPPGQPIQCEGGYFVLDRQLSGNSEGTASNSAWTLYIAIAASGDLIAKEHRVEYQRSMLVISTFSASDRWYRFAPER
jgi:hypothetical protein